MDAGHVPHLVGAVVAFLLISAATLAFTRRVRLPFTVALVLVGILLDQLARHGPALLRGLGEYDLSPEVILYVFLPTLIFESAFHMDGRQLRRNLGPVLVLAAPGLVLSTALIGAVVWAATPLEPAVALLLGAILSATDPVAVIALFKQLGAPRRLTILVEGESLFNDATAIVAARIILGVIAAGTLDAGTALSGIASFVVVFAGGALVGWLLGWTAAALLGRVHDQPMIEITLTTVLAYASFLVAEEGFHVSGVMATVTAAIVLGGPGKTRISASAAESVEHFWEYMAFVANALIFVLVGMRVQFGAMLGALDILGWSIVAMLLSRAVIVYGLAPVIARLPGAEPIERSYQTVMWWGGLRGAIALAVALSLGEAEYAPVITAVVTGVVLFTLLVQGLSIEALVRRLGLDVPPVADRYARLEVQLAAQRHAAGRIPELQQDGLFSARVADGIRSRLQEGTRATEAELSALRGMELDPYQERQLLFLRGFSAERNQYYEMYASGHLSERACRDLVHSIDVQSDLMRYEGRLPAYTLHPPRGEQLESLAVRCLDRMLGLTPLPERLRAARTARDYEEAWGRHQASGELLRRMALGQFDPSGAPALLDEVRRHYEHWHLAARERLDVTAELFPEFVSAMQEKLGERLVLHAQQHLIEGEARCGLIPAGIAEPMLQQLAERVRTQSGSVAGKLRTDPSELLRKVPFFEALPPDEFGRVSARLRPRTVPSGDAIIRQGDAGDSLFLIARGVVRVSRLERDHVRDLATLLAGDFFGEFALLHGERRSATCRAVTPCSLYELRRDDFDAVRDACPAMQEALASAEGVRRAQQLA